MADSHHHWVTLHRVRFPEEISALERTFDAPEGLDFWRFCPSQHIGPNGLPTWISDTWCGFACHATSDGAEAMLADPVAAFPALDEAVEAWHAIAVPVTHRGEVNWRGEVEENSALSATAEAPAGQLAVITSAGYNSRDPSQLPRVAAFTRGIAEVMEFYAGEDGHLRNDTFNGGFDGKDGFTLTLWRDQPSMMKAAYHPGVHRTLMDASRDGSTFDRSSFTRLSVIASHGSWRGNPLAAAS